MPLVLLRAHDVENVESKENLYSIVRALLELSEGTTVRPIHPRTRRRLVVFRPVPRAEKLDRSASFTLWGTWISCVYFYFHLALVLTDSGGVQEKVLTLQVSCLTLRHNTERPESIEVGANIIVSTKTEQVIAVSRKLLSDPHALRAMKTKKPLGDGKAGTGIALICVDSCERGISIESPSYYEWWIRPIRTYSYRREIDRQDGRRHRISL